MSYASEVLADSPNGYWRMDESSGQITDSSGNSHDSTTINGSPTYSQPGALASDPSSTSILFAPDESFEIPDHADFDLGDTFTLEAWVQLGATGESYTIFDKGANAYNLFVYDVDGQLHLERNGVATLAKSTDTFPVDSSFHHVVATKDGSTIAIYLDGEDVTSAGTNSTCTDTAVNLFIGDSNFGFSGWSGRMDELAVYPTALSAARVLAHYNAAFESLLSGRRYKRLAGPQQLASSAADLYTVPAGTRTQIRHFHISNPSGADVDATLSVGTDAAGTRILDAHPIPANSIYSPRRPAEYTLEAGEKIQGWASTGSTLVIEIDGVEETL